MPSLVCALGWTAVLCTGLLSPSSTASIALFHGAAAAAAASSPPPSSVTAVASRHRVAFQPPGRRSSAIECGSSSSIDFRSAGSSSASFLGPTTSFASPSSRCGGGLEIDRGMSAVAPWSSGRCTLTTSPHRQPLPPAAFSHRVRRTAVSLVNPRRTIYSSSSVLRATSNEDGEDDNFFFASPITPDETSGGAEVLTDRATLRQSYEKEPTNEVELLRSYESFNPLFRPIASTLDNLTGEWALSYADLSPETPTSPAGAAFLATNACYATAGLILGVRGEWTLGLLTELAGVVSFWYHYSQLNFGADRSEVRLALLTDYFTAGAALITGGVYMAQLGIDSIPFDALVVGAASVVCLTLCWLREFGYWYLFWHSLWHILSAYTGYVIGQAHLTNGGTMM